ncbi:MAG: saccharopine dehydrogenase NADP-binding domain-containing protein [Gemmatimonadetes bacterium]|nr:saccharopine dehydrogenase NADP-binding domain-containing protein [Gemmatimonadota bacterium]
MRMLVLGSGLQGSACALDLLTTTDAKVTLADRAPEHVAPFLQPYRGKRLAVMAIDARDERSVREVLRGHAGVLCAFPYYLNVPMARLAIEAGAHFCDLGGNTEIVRQQEALGPAAEAKGVSVVPDCGVAPGMVNILAVEGIRRLEATDSVKLYVGGLPQHPQPPLNYSIVYSLEGVLDYYTTPSRIVRGGKVVEVDALSELELVEFPPPLGGLEAFHTAGGVSTMPWEIRGVQSMEYKTLRYPGHAAIMRAIRDLGLLSLEPVEVKGKQVVPRDAFIAVVDPKLRRSDPDLIALRVEVRGRAGGKPAAVMFQVLDYYDARHHVSAMMRTTGYSLSITGQMQAAGKVEPGVRVAYQAVPYQPYVDELKKRGIDIQETEKRVKSAELKREK